jgi:hypothetical protein
MLFVSTVASAADKDKVDGFKTAAGNAGCEAIPYQSERENCKDLQRSMKEICTNFSCDRDLAEKQIDKLKEKRKNLEDAKSRNNNSAIPDLERAIKELEDSLKELKYDATAHRVSRCEDCISAREKIQRLFSDVRTKVKGESGDKDLNSYVDNLVDKYDQGAKEHVQPIEDVKRALENCKWVRSMSY